MLFFSHQSNQTKPNQPTKCFNSSSTEEQNQTKHFVLLKQACKTNQTFRGKRIVQLICLETRWRKTAYIKPPNVQRALLLQCLYTFGYLNVFILLASFFVSDNKILVFQLDFYCITETVMETWKKKKMNAFNSQGNKKTKKQNKYKNKT